MTNFACSCSKDLVVVMNRNDALTFAHRHSWDGVNMKKIH